MRTENNRMISRRAVLAGLVLVPSLGMAHGDHGPTRIGIEAKVLRVRKTVATMRFGMANTASTPIELRGLTVEGAKVAPLAKPFEIGGFGVGEIKVEMDFGETVPDFITATLDFGHHGKRSVRVAR